MNDDEPLLEGPTEENVITLLCYSKEQAPIIAGRLSHEIFGTEPYRIIAEAAIKYIDKYHAPPGPHIVDILETEIRTGARGELLYTILGRMEQAAPHLNPTYIMEQLDRFIEEQRLGRALLKAIDHLKAHDIEQCRAAANQTLAVPIEKPGIWLHDPEQALRFLDHAEEDYFPSGVPDLDDLGVRPRRKTMFLIIAPAKAGKSFWLVEIGRQAIFHHKRVLHITLEMSDEETARRYVQALHALGRDKEQSVSVPIFQQSGQLVSFHDLTRAGVQEQGKRVLAQSLRNLRRRAKLYIKEFPTASLTIMQLNAFLDMMKVQEHFEPDLLIIDYGDLMALNTEYLRLDTGQLFRQLRGIAVQRNLALVTATQGNRSSGKAKLVTSDMVAEDWSKIATADIVMTYSRTQLERDRNLARLLVSASRTTADQMQILISQSYATGQFCLDSRIFNNALKAQLQDMENDHRSTGN